MFFDYRNKNITEFKSNFKFDHKEYILTTIGQLNFFRFAIQDDIIKYAIEHIEEIERDMNSTLKNRENEKSNVKNGNGSFMEVKSIKRKELSAPGNKSVHITRISAVIKFL